ncbi:uncharacterized protein [Rutidosis leptorrhynchoides]|uniref:uncharacterized protein n=1 Tax=Rutidosis leptorrhynchoides TaxID=125765 RepID=UPI003A99FE89
MTGDKSYDNTKRLEKATGPARGRNFMMTTDDAKKSNEVVLGTFLVNSKLAKVLFDSGADMSYVSLKYAATLDCPLCDRDYSLQVEIADGRFSVANRVYKNCVIDFGTEKFDIDLVPITLGEFFVVVGMDWLDQNRANLDCHEKFVRVRTPSGGELIVYGESRRRHVPICTYARARRLVSSGGMAYLSHVVDTRDEPPPIKSIPVVDEIEDVFPEELPGVPPVRQLEFRIDLVPGANPIAKTPYLLAPNEMHELLNQTQELLERALFDQVARHGSVKKYEHHLHELLKTLCKEKLYAKFSKCEFWFREVQYLGHIVNHEGSKVDPGKVEAVKDWERLTTPTELTRKNVKFEWGDVQENAFQLLKRKLCQAPVLMLLEGVEDMVVYCDASISGLGCVLMQRDHKNLEYFFGQHDINNRQRRWLDLLKDYDLDIRYHPGKANVVADALGWKNQVPSLQVKSLRMIPSNDFLEKVGEVQIEAFVHHKREERI